jgi:hypothetical protein
MPGCGSSCGGVEGVERRVEQAEDHPGPARSRTGNGERGRRAVPGRVNNVVIARTYVD